jgi:hypothetical protein
MIDVQTKLVESEGSESSEGSTKDDVFCQQNSYIENGNKYNNSLMKLEVIIDASANITI